MQIPFVAYGSVISVLISLIISSILIHRKGWTLESLSFAFTVFFMSVWVLTETFYHFNEPESLSNLIILIGYSSVALMSTSLLIFMTSLWKRDNQIFAIVIAIGLSIALIPFIYPQGHNLEKVGDIYMSFAGPVFFWTGIPYSAIAYMGSSIFLLWVSRNIKGNSKRRMRITSTAFLLQYPISSLSYIYGQIIMDPLLTSVVQSLTLPFTLGAILYSLIY